MEIDGGLKLDVDRSEVYGGVAELQCRGGGVAQFQLGKTAFRCWLSRKLVTTCHVLVSGQILH